MWDFPDDPDVTWIGREVYENGGVVTAVCHGPAALLGITLRDGSYLISGKRVAGFTNSELCAAPPLKYNFLYVKRWEGYEDHDVFRVPGEIRRDSQRRDRRP
jgi:hypothetical protein